MNISLGCAHAAASRGPATSAVASAPIRTDLSFMLPPPLLVGERPETQLLFRNLPEPRQSTRFNDQEEDDEAAEDHQLELFLERHRQREPDQVRRVGEEDRHQ